MLHHYINTCLYLHFTLTSSHTKNAYKGKSKQASDHMLIALTFMDVVCGSGWGTSSSVSGGACTASKVLPKTAKN